MSKADELRAELKVAELEESFVEAKSRGEATEEMKQNLREARRQWRELREAQAAEVAEGDAVVRPGTVEVTAEAQNLGEG